MRIINFYTHAKILRFLLFFYLIATVGFSLDFSKVFFKILIPYALFVNFVLLAIFINEFRKQDFFILFCIYAISMFIEIFGVKTGKIFGQYHYGFSLGLKIFDVPLIIGLNWLFLSYTTSVIVDKLRVTVLLKVILASFLMVLYDFFLENVAPKLDMWYWKNDIPPLLNFVAWFVLSFVLTSIIFLSKINLNNMLAPWLFIFQFLFFIALNITL